MTTLVIIDQAPYGSWSGREALDMVFSLAAFDQPAALLFCGAGVNWLRRGQDAAAIGQKSVEKNLSAAALFGVDQILAEQPACERYGLSAEDLLPGTEQAGAVSDVVANYDQVLFAS